MTCRTLTAAERAEPVDPPGRVYVCTYCRTTDRDLGWCDGCRLCAVLCYDPPERDERGRVVRAMPVNQWPDGPYTGAIWLGD